MTKKYIDVSNFRTRIYKGCAYHAPRNQYGCESCMGTAITGLIEIVEELANAINATPEGSSS